MAALGLACMLEDFVVAQGLCAGRFGTCAGRGGGGGDLVYVLESLVVVEGQVCAVEGLCQEGFVGWEELGFVPGL